MLCSTFQSLVSVGNFCFIFFCERLVPIFPKVCVINNICQAFEENFLSSNKGSRRPALISEKLLTELRCMKEDTRVGSRGRWLRRSRDAVLSCRDVVRKAKAILKFSLVKKIKKGFYKFQTGNFIKIIEKMGDKKILTAILF